MSEDNFQKAINQKWIEARDRMADQVAKVYGLTREQAIAYIESLAKERDD